MKRSLSFLSVLIMVLPSCLLIQAEKEEPRRAGEKGEVKWWKGKDPGKVGEFVASMRKKFPSLRQRVVEIARSLLGQPYKIYLLGEFPFELYDPDPLFCLEKSDCVTFVEHVYAMALSHDWRSFMVILQRIRYMRGEIGITTRNHFTIPDWEHSNSWLVKEITSRLPEKLTRPIVVKTGRRSFFKKWGLGKDFKEKTVKVKYVPAQYAPVVLKYLKQGDMVQVIRGRGNSAWCGHVGLVGRKGGIVTFIHSTRPRVREEPILDYAERNLRLNERRKSSGKALFLGFRFLRLEEDPVGNLRKVDGPGAPFIVIHAEPGRPDGQ